MNNNRSEVCHICKYDILIGKNTYNTKCAMCGKGIENVYDKCIDEFFQIKFSDSIQKSDSMFCSQVCFQEYLTLQNVNKINDKSDDYYT